MRTFTIIIVTVIATILVEIIALFALFWFVNPFGMRSMLFQGGETSNATTTQMQESDVVRDDAHPYLNSDQEEMIRNIGIDPAKLPTEITPELEACMRQKLGDERIAELNAGAEPSASDLFQSRSCWDK